MMNISDNNKKVKFSREEARSFVRELWVSFNSFNMYGPEHPAARKESKKLYQHLKGMLDTISRLTLHTEAGSLFCEEWQMDREVDIKRLVERMNSLGIHSITFFDSLRQEDLLELIKIIIDARKFKELESIIEYLKENKTRGFIFNYYRFKKIPSGGFEVLGQEGTQSTAGPGEGPVTGKGSPAEKLIAGLLRDQPGLLYFSEKLRAIRTRFDAGGGPEVEKLREVVSRLKALLDENYLYGVDEETSPEEWNSTLAELDSITISIMSRAVLEALQNQDQPIKGMAQFFRKLDPDLDFTMKALPRIKKNLFDNGITLLQYLQFIQSLSDELTLKEFKSLLLETRGDIGVTNQEIMAEIEKNREELIPLVTLAIKIEPLMSDSAKPMMNFLYQHAEKELRSLVLKSIANITIEKSEDIDPYLEDTKQQYLRELAEGGMVLKIVQDLNSLIIRRKTVLWGLIWAQLLIESTGAPDRLPNGEELRLLAEKIKSISGGKNLLNPMLYILEKKGLSRELLNRFIKIVSGKKSIETPDAAPEAEKIETKAEKDETGEKEDLWKSYRLPPGILGMKETQRYLDLEISRTLRYHTPFSCLSISVPRVKEGKQLREPGPNELAVIFLEIGRRLRDSLRNLDFVGSLGTIKDNHIFIIMTMTDIEGCKKVAMRLGEGFKEVIVQVGGISISAGVIISTITFNPEETPDMQSFIRLVKSRHHEEI